MAEDTILGVGSQEDTHDNLVSYYSQISEKETKENIKALLKSSKGPLKIVEIMKSFNKEETLSSPQTEKKRLEITSTIVTEVIRNASIPNNNARIYLDAIELDKLSDPSLARIEDRCRHSLEEESPTGFRWLPFLGRVLSVIQSRDQFQPHPDHGGDTDTGAAWVEAQLRDILDLRWSPDLVTGMCAVFKDIKLTPSMQEEIFSKLVSYFKKLPASSIPPLVLQLLQFLKDSQPLSRQLLASINEFFSSRLTPEDRDGAASNVDLDSIELVSDDGTKEELMQAESIVIYHLHSAASNGHIIGREVINLVKSAAQAPDLMLKTFSLFLFITFISLKQYEEAILNSLKTAILRTVAIEESRQNYVWIRSVMKKLPSIGDLLSVVITQSKKSGGWDLICQGILELGLHLLDVACTSKAESRKVKTIHNIGARLLVKLVKNQRELCRPVISALTSKILTTGPASVQYTEALRITVADTAALLMETPHEFDELVENVARLPYNTSRRALHALLPLVRLSRVLRDLIILSLRKLLFCSAVDARQAATAGVLLLLRSFRVSTTRSVSQLSQTQGSGSLSQVAVDVHRGAATSNEALCLELLGVLRRCFVQPCEVKMVFYVGVIDVINKNPEMCEGVLELAHSHLLALWGPEGSSRHRWQLNLDKIVREHNDTWAVEEPVGWFLNCLQQIVNKTQQVSEEDNDVLGKVTSLLDEMVEKYGDCEPGELGFDETDNFDKKTKNGEKKVLQLEQLRCLLESLMEYVFCHGADYNIEKTNQMLNLYNTHSALHNVMVASLQRQKNKKGEKGKKVEKKDATDEVSNEHIKSTQQYSPPLGCLSLKCLSLMLKAILLDKTPSHRVSLEKLRENPKFVDFILETLSTKLKQISGDLEVNGDEGVQSDADFKFLLSLLNTLYAHAVATEAAVPEAQKKITASMTECLKMLVLYFPRRKLRIISCLTDETLARKDGNMDELLMAALEPLHGKIQHYLGRLEDPAEEDIPQKLTVSIEAFRVLMEGITEEQNMVEAFKLARQINENVTTEDVSVLKSVASLVFFTILKSKERSDWGNTMARKIHSLSGDLDTTVRVEQIDKCPWVSDANKYHILPFLLNFLDEQYTQAEMVLVWLKSVCGFMDCAQVVLKAEGSLCFLLAKQTNTLSELIKSTIPVGVHTDAVMKLLQKQYTITGTLTKHFIQRSKEKRNLVEQAKFDQLIRGMSGQLTKNVTAFLQYVDNERSGKEKEEASKKGAKQKVLGPDAARAKVIRESRVTTNLVLKVEQLESDLIKLAKRVNNKDLCKGAKMGNRDFRLKMDRLPTDSGDDSGDEDQEEEEEEEAEDDPTPVHHSTAMGDITNRSVSVRSLLHDPDLGSGPEEEPVKKKMKI